MTKQTLIIYTGTLTNSKHVKDHCDFVKYCMRLKLSILLTSDRVEVAMKRIEDVELHQSMASLMLSISIKHGCIIAATAKAFKHSTQT